MKSRKTVDKDFVRHELLKRNIAPAPNPLDIFPSKKDTLTRAFFATDLPRHVKKKEEKDRWLHTDQINPEFGIKGDSQEVEIRRSYRRVASSQAFTPLRRDDMPLSELYRARHGTHKKFVLVEEDRLAELSKFESILRDEKEKMGEQCTWVISDLQQSARIPIPAIRLAMHNLCEAEMKKAAHGVHKLLEGWKDYSRKNGYSKSVLFFNESYINSAPVAQRAAKLKQLKKSNKEWLQRKERDTMSFEDDLSRLNEKYLNAQIRRRDYDRYFVLATRYGLFSEEEFYRDSHPGDRYYKAVVGAAAMLQRLWAVYWPVKNMRMHRAARLFQTLYRCFKAYKMWHPIIRIRIKVGKRALFKHMWQRWSEYNHLCREIKAAITWYRENWMDRCFYAWRDYIKTLKSHNTDLLNRFVRRMKNIQVAGLYMRWVTFTKKSKHTKMYCRRIFQNPHFLIWVEYTKRCKHLKYLGKFAAKIQAGVRMFVEKTRFQRICRAAIVLQGYGRIVMAKNETHRRRELVVNEAFQEWLPGEMASRGKRANEKEKRRLVWEQQLMQEKEQHMVTDLKRHLQSKNGKYQLNLEAEKIRKNGIVDENGNRVSGMNKRQALKLAKAAYIDRCSEISRSMGKHDFNTKNPAPYRCADNSCRAIFASPEQYHQHMKHSERHRGKEPQYSQIHISMQTSKFQETLREYLAHIDGIDKLVNCLDLWISIQEWRKTPISTEMYVQKAMNVYETFLSDDCTRPVGLDVTGMEAILEKLKTVKYREFEGMYKVENGKVTWWRWLFGLDGRAYEAWTTDNVVYADCFDEIEWRAFLHIFEQLQRTDFMNSSTGRIYLKEEEDAKIENNAILLDLYRDFRFRNIVLWTKGFMLQEKKIGEMALQLADLILEEEATRLMNKGGELGADAAVFEVMHEEQRVAEGADLLADDSVYWAMEDMIEDVYEHFVHATVEKMWEDADSRKTLLEFAGYLRKSAKAKLLISMNVKNQSHDWFNEFVNSAIDDEKKTLPLDPDSASTAIQRRWRGVLGRNKVRKIFVQVYRKTYDASSGSYYYVNLKTQQSAWERPAFMIYLFPNTTW